MRITNNLGLPEEFVWAYRSYRAAYDKGDAYKSASGIISPVQASELIRQHYDEIAVDVADQLPSIIGSAMHSLLAAANYGDPMATLSRLREVVRDGALPGRDRLRHMVAILKDFYRPVAGGRVVEERLFATVDVPGYGPVRISGQMDLQSQGQAGWLIRDFKLTSTWAVIDGLKTEWEQQGNIYAFLLRENGRDVTGAEFVAMLKDWSRTKAKFESSYPSHAVVILRAPLRDHEWVRDWIARRLRLHLDAENLGAWPECTPEERWVRESKWVVRKPDNKRASRLLESEEEARAWAGAREAEGPFEISYREGASVRCEGYCNAAPWCEQWKAIQDERLP